MRSIVVATMACAVVAAPALAGERTGYRAIVDGDFGRAEATLNAERRIFPNRAELMLNLAAVYSKTGRAESARQLYGEVLKRPSVSMLMPTGNAESSHGVAQRGLAKLDAPVFATR